jgi:hypothetical protein
MFVGDASVPARSNKSHIFQEALPLSGGWLVAPIIAGVLIVP